jgi:hypothetical protein
MSRGPLEEREGRGRATDGVGFLIKKADKWVLQWIEDDIEYGWVQEKLI